MVNVRSSRYPSTCRSCAASTWKRCGRGGDISRLIMTNMIPIVLIDLRGCSALLFIQACRRATCNDACDSGVSYGVEHGVVGRDARRDVRRGGQPLAQNPELLLFMRVSRRDRGDLQTNEGPHSEGGDRAMFQTCMCRPDRDDPGEVALFSLGGRAMLV